MELTERVPGGFLSVWPKNSALKIIPKAGKQVPTSLRRNWGLHEWRLDGLRQPLQSGLEKFSLPY